ncbi:cyclase family protein [Haladaptatus sp. CMAA 1911]|uniref:cyclase family protein n=1 Tax=unclassified Haladaptatus TaxID=2622732 RepID=UPI003754C663
MQILVRSSFNRSAVGCFCSHLVVENYLTPKDAITVDDITPYESEIQNGDVVIIYTEWDDYYGLTDEYLFEFPYLTAETHSISGS